MKEKIRVYSSHWRDILVVLTALLVLGSFLLLTYSVGQSNKLAAQTRELAIQNQAIAQKSTDHLNCIVRDLATPRPPGAGQKYIELVGKDCNIKFTP